jgi:hypothetical protein
MRRRGPGEKAKAQRLHARRRAVERYGIEMGRATRQEILASIRGSRSTCVERQSHRVSIHDVVLGDGVTVRVVYDRQSKEIVSFLPRP